MISFNINISDKYCLFLKKPLFCQMFIKHLFQSSISLFTFGLYPSFSPVQSRDLRMLPAELCLPAHRLPVSGAWVVCGNVWQWPLPLTCHHVTSLQWL